MIFLKKIIGVLYTGSHILLVPYLVWQARKRDQVLLKKYTFGVAEKWGRRMFRLFNTEVEIIGRENIPDEPVVVIANHQAGMDIPLLLGFLPNKVSFIAKKELKKMPVVSTWMKYLNCFFIDRSSARSALASFQECSSLIKNGQSVVIFPEGTRNPDLMPFKKGSFKLPIMAKVPILPVTIIGTEKAFSHGRKKVRLVIGQPVSTSNLSKVEQENLTMQVEKIIKDNFQNYSMKN